MGYTHYFTTKNSLDNAKFKELSNSVQKVIDACNVPLAYEYDAPNDKPLVNHQTIRFNGIGNDGHETLLIEADKIGFEFCKTARKPYDITVTATLSLAKHFFGDDIDIGSDGDYKDWQDGVELAINATGINLSNPMTKD